MGKTVFRQSIITLIVVSLAIFYFNCGDDSVATVTPTLTPISCIYGRLTNWTYGNTLTLKARVYSKTNHIYPVATCPIDSQGNFNLCLPSSLSDTTMFRADSVFYSNCPGSASVNPPEARGAEIFNLLVYTQSNLLFGYVTKSNFSGTPIAGSFEAMYIYVNENLSVTGTKYCSPDTLQFNGNAVTGWNQIIRNFERVSQNGNTILYNNTEPPGAEWKFFP